MRVIIVGAGEIGKQLAHVLCYRNNDVVVIDQDESVLEALKEQLDILTYVGNGAAGQVLMKVGIEKTDLLLAVTSNSEANILACNIANHFRVPLKVARIQSNEYFNPSTEITKEKFGVDHAIIPEYECAINIFDALLRPSIKETVEFDQPGVSMVNFQVKPGSPMIGSTLKDFPKPDLLEKLRICAILRFGELIIPGGNDSFIAFDEVYAAGNQSIIDSLISWAAPSDRIIEKVIIAGGTRIGIILASMLATAEIRVCFIEANPIEADRLADRLHSSVLIIQGESTDTSVLIEAGIEDCDAFIAANLDDEVNILSCLLANNHSSGKVIAVTSNRDYLRILAGMNMIDCCFSPMVAAVNNLIKLIKTENRQTVAMLKRTSAEVLQMTVHKRSILSGKRIRDIEFPAKMIFALILRNKTLFPAIGDLVLETGDQVVILTERDSMGMVDKLFASKGGF